METIDEIYQHDAYHSLSIEGYQVTAELIDRVASGNWVPDDNQAHRGWYRGLFGPQVAAGLLDAAQLAGYRNQPVYLRGSRHVPPRWEVLQYAMPALFDILESEPNPAVRAILSHWLVGYIHPFPDGNGRIARFMMNSLLATAGYPWTIIHVKDREEYLATLERASVDNALAPFTRFVAAQMQRTDIGRL